MEMRCNTYAIHHKLLCWFNNLNTTLCLCGFIRSVIVLLYIFIILKEPLITVASSCQVSCNLPGVFPSHINFFLLSYMVREHAHGQWHSQDISTGEGVCEEGCLPPMVGTFFSFVYQNSIICTLNVKGIHVCGGLDQSPTLFLLSDQQGWGGPWSVPLCPPPPPPLAMPVHLGLLGNIVHVCWQHISVTQVLAGYKKKINKS